MILTLDEQQSTTDQDASAEAPGNVENQIKIPLVLDNWKTLPQDIQDDLTWFHGYILETGMSLHQAGQAINYDKTVVFKVLKGSYEGNWNKIADAVRSLKKIAIERGKIQKALFVQNAISKLIWGGLNRAIAHNSITIIIGDSGRGKTESAKAWRDANNHGRSVFVTAPAYGGTKRLLLDIATAVGHGRDHKNTFQLHHSIMKAFNPHRILIVDEAHRLLPCKGSSPRDLELLRDLSDQTGCALGLLATARFDSELRRSDYMFEQLLRRAFPVRLPRLVPLADIQPILLQYLKRPTVKVSESAVAIANSLGSIGELVEILKDAAKLAFKKSRPMCEEDFFTAMAIRKSMMGETQFAKKD
jgi:DNA transposition AAA+ family ATPase